MIKRKLRHWWAYWTYWRGLYRRARRRPRHLLLDRDGLYWLIESSGGPLEGYFVKGGKVG